MPKDSSKLLIERADFAGLGELAAHRQMLWRRQREVVTTQSRLLRELWARDGGRAGWLASTNFRLWIGNSAQVTGRACTVGGYLAVGTKGNQPDPRT